MHWTIGQFPELDHLAPDERAALLRRVPWWTYPVVIVRAAVGALVFGGSAVLALSVVRARTHVVFIAFVAVTAVAAVALYLQELNALRRAVRREVAEGFRGRRPPFCFGCGYDLRACRTSLCPECGRDVTGQGTAGGRGTPA